MMFRKFFPTNKPIFVATTISFLAVLTCSCSDESIVGSSRVNEGNSMVTSPVCSGLTHTNVPVDIKYIYLFALDAEETTISMTVYDSIADLGFPLTIQQAEMIKAGEIIEIDDPRMVSVISSILFHKGSITGNTSITLVGIISSDLDILCASWGCMKKCMNAPDVKACLNKCEEKDKDNGRDIHVGY